VPQAELACGRVRDDRNVMAAQPVGPALKVLVGVSCLHGRQLLYLHGVGIFPPRASVMVHAQWAFAIRLGIGAGLVVRGGDFSWGSL
jgi:hypothetical protein